MPIFIYESHLGRLYADDSLLSSEDLYCESCGKSDWFIGAAFTKEEAVHLLIDYYKDGFYDEEECEDWIEEHYGDFLNTLWDAEDEN